MSDIHTDRCPRCLGSGKARDLHTTTVEAAARYEEFLGGHNYPRCGRCSGTGRVEIEACGRGICARPAGHDGKV